MSGSELPMDTFRSRCRVVQERTGSSSDVIGEYSGTARRYVRSYPSGNKEPPDGCLRATHRVVMELPADKFRTTRQVFPKYLTTSSELLTDDLRTTFGIHYQLVAGFI